MSEPMDLEKAVRIRNEVEIFIDRDGCCFDETGADNVIIKALASERRRLIERFRPVIEKLEAEHSRKPFNPMCDCNLCFALEVLHEIEKENGQ